nr:PREDICTED: dual specificity protein phosphatase 15 [Anolis carolinensis]|eukprot:XP_016852984.1 PREDICTED: dual specificity protein phosphatase 15 [Anolis carolinensis]
MGNGMNKVTGATGVLPGLFLGNFIDAKDFDQLSRHNITHIISIHESPQPYIPGITYLRIVLPDTPEANIKKHFKKCILFIHSCRLRGGNCLVHCLAGISRSTTLVLAYIMTVTQASWREALQAVKAVRPVANPNPGFRQQLEKYEGSRSEQKIRRRLERKYGENPFNDVEEIGALLTTGKRRETFRDEDATQAAMPKSTGAKRTDPFLLRMKETFFCLRGA